MDLMELQSDFLGILMMIIFFPAVIWCLVSAWRDPYPDMPK